MFYCILNKYIMLIKTLKINKITILINKFFTFIFNIIRPGSGQSV
jgi:hypothetical protein